MNAMRVHSIPLDPNVTLLLFAAGVLLVYWEMCRPGMVLPGAAGLTLAILAAAKLTAAPSGSIRWWVAAAVGTVLLVVTAVLGCAAVLGFVRKRSLG